MLHVLRALCSAYEDLIAAFEQMWAEEAGERAGGVGGGGGLGWWR
jgi:hypothetical protein